VVEVVLSTASIAGGALFGPIIWSLFTTRQTAFSLVTVSIISLVVSLFFKVISPGLFHVALNRTWETVLGEGLPVLLLAAFELYYKFSKLVGPAYLIETAEISNLKTKKAYAASQQQNVFGIKVIAVSMAVIGAGITVIGALASSFSIVVMGVGLFILLCAVMIWISVSAGPKISVQQPVTYENIEE